MATTEVKRRGLPLWAVPAIRDYRAPAWFERLPRGIGPGGVLVVLLALSGFIRAHYLSGQFWWEEAGMVGVATHPLTAIPGLLWRGAGAPLYPLLLHLWMSRFGSSESAVHGLSLLFGLLSVPLAMWTGWGLFGRRAGFLAAGLFAFNAFLTQYAEEAGPYELLCLFGLLGTAAFLHAFVYGRRWGVPVFGLALLGLVYTDDWGLFFWLGAAVALAWIAWRAGPEGERRRMVWRDGVLAFAGAAILFVPWVPTLIHQASASTAGWRYAPLLGVDFPRRLLGSDRVDAALAIAVVAGLGPLLARSRRRLPEATASAVLVLICAGAVIGALIASIWVPAWVARDMGPVVPALLLLCALGCARSGILGLVVAVVTCAFLANAASFIPTYKSDMRDIAGEFAPHLHPGDLVLVGQPEQAPLAWYYLPGGLRYATPVGPDRHPSYTDWDGALTRLRRADPRMLVDQLVASLAPGQRLLYVRPLTEGESQWAQSWSALVRRRAAQLSAALVSDPQLRPVPGVFAPHNYRGSCCVASSAQLFVRMS